MPSTLDKSEELYLTKLAAIQGTALGPDFSSKNTYIPAKGYMLPYSSWGNLNINSKALLLDDSENFVREKFFAKEKIPNTPHYKEMGNRYPILYISGKQGVGKRTFLKKLVSGIAIDYAKGVEKYFPLYFEFKKPYTVEDIKHYFAHEHNLLLDSRKSYFFIFYSMLDSGTSTSGCLKKITGGFEKIIMESFPKSRIILLSSPIGGGGGVFSLDIKSKSGRFLCLSGFTEKQVGEHISNYEKKYKSIPKKLSYSYISDKLLGKDDAKNPLILNILFKLFETGESMDSLQSTMTRSEIYLRFVNSLSFDFKEIQLYRSTLRKMAAMQQIENMGKKKDGINIKEFLEDYDSEEDFCRIIETKNSVSYLTENKRLIKFKHKSFYDYFLAEYILSVFLLALCDENTKFKLHVGYISEGSMYFLVGLLNLLKMSDKNSDLFKGFILSLSCKNVTEELFEKKSFKLKKEPFSKLLNIVRKWLGEQTVYFAADEKPKKLFNTLLCNKSVMPSYEHIFCESWYCLVFLQVFEEDIGDIYLGDMLKESLRSYFFNNYLLNFLSGTNLEGADLKGAYLREANLGRANLVGVDLSGAYLVETNLCEADLSCARLYSTNLREANLTNANLTGANLRESKLIRANLREVNLGGAKLYNTDLSEINFKDASLRGANLFKADLHAANLSGADLSGAYLNKVCLVEANLFEAKLNGADLSEANMAKAYLRDADLSKANLSGTDLNETYLKGAKIYKTRLGRTTLEGKI